MPTEPVSLTLKGSPGAQIRVIPRTHGEEEIDPVYTGNLDANGSLTVSLPRAHYVIVTPGHPSTPVHLDVDSPPTTIELPQ